MDKDNEIKTKGLMFFFYGEKGLNFIIHDYESDFEKEYYAIYKYYLIDGLSFLEDVRHGGFIDYDGYISEIIIDDYKSNLGLCEEGLCSGKFLVTGEIFEQICKEHKVQVNWVNK
nr:MAG TPA: LicD family [Caudoviricetes sp.]